jgi:uncharacterized protein YlxW (UPF0749 family)
MTLIKDYTAEDLQNAFDKGRAAGREETAAELEQESRLMRARNERLEAQVVDYEKLIRDLTDALRAAGGKTHGT